MKRERYMRAVLQLQHILEKANDCKCSQAWQAGTEVLTIRQVKFEVPWRISPIENSLVNSFVCSGI